jgi:hypothetical protein
MNRRGFIGSLLALPLLRKIKAETADVFVPTFPPTPGLNVGFHGKPLSAHEAISTASWGTHAPVNVWNPPIPQDIKKSLRKAAKLILENGIGQPPVPESSLPINLTAENYAKLEQADAMALATGCHPLYGLV